MLRKHRLKTRVCLMFYTAYDWFKDLRASLDNIDRDQRRGSGVW